MQKFIGFEDAPAREDKFEISPYIDGLAQFIQTCVTPMTIAVQGDWGAGKTSIMRMIKDKLGVSEDSANIGENVFVIDFNTWEYSQFGAQDNLTSSFLATVVYSLDLKGKFSDHATNFLTKIGQLAKIGAVSVAGKIGGASAGAATYDMLSSLTKSGGTQNLKNDFQQAVDSALAQKSKESGRKIDRLVVFIDDLDRITPARAVELLETLKNYLDSKNCVFVLAIDANVVYRGIREKYGADVSDEKARSFFDKIIQVPFAVPIDVYDVESYVKDKLKRLNIEITGKKAAKKLKNITNLVKYSIGKNPRSMIRLFNSFALLEIIVKNVGDKDEKSGEQILSEQRNRRLLFATLCMQSKFEKYYKKLVYTRLSADLIDSLCDAQSEFYADSAEGEDGQKNLFVKFAAALRRVIDDNDDGALDEDEIEAFERVLHYSLITSTNNAAAIERVKAFKAKKREYEKEYEENLKEREKDEQMGVSSPDNSNLNSNLALAPLKRVLTPVKNGEKWGFANAEGELKIDFIYDDVCEKTKFAKCEDGYASGYFGELLCVQKGEKWGFVSAEGIESGFIYDEPPRFCFGRGESAFLEVQKGFKHGVICCDSAVREIVPCKFDYAELTESGDFVKVRKNGKSGLYDLAGKLVAPCKFDFIDADKYPFIKVKNQGKYGALDRKGGQILPCKFEQIRFDAASENLIADDEEIRLEK